ncbi:DUF2799 domain-containing protein [uncultured Photobacterium sp.]|uniref:DUF2799 domain-containing protein n=1 Tax=uncultured Photobacterium sp. TaxID=173973 RepID=UPI0026221103|nr:DUF2799 domain-containing protein [uncultured Photobacterium sp.]
MYKRPLCMVVLVQLVGCSSMSVEECKVADWYSVGLQDGQNGAPSSRVSDYAEDCLEANVTVDQAVWFNGYDLGLTYYCMPDNGYRIGRSGGGYYGVCDSPLFLEQYNLGRKEYQVEQRIREIDRELASIANQLRQLEKNAKYNSDEGKRLRSRESMLRSERRSLMVPTIQYHFTF